MPRTPNVFITNNKAAADPTVNDDDAAAYDVGSRWTNTATQKVFFAVNVATGSAVWKDVSTPGAGSHPVTVDTVDPAVTDDSNSGFALGDHWINSVTQGIFQVVDVSVGAAVWIDVSASGAHPVTVDTVDPTVTDDSNSGFAVGDHWINTASLPPRAFQVMDVSVGAAVWRRLSNLKNNIDTTQPAVTDDGNSDYEVGSQWYNSQTHELFICLDASVGAAIWRLTGGLGAHTLAGTVFYGGTVAVYPSVASDQDNEIQYVAVRLQADKLYDRMVVFIDSGGLAGRTIHLGVYDQTTPFPLADPVSRVAQTDSVATGAANGSYFATPITDGAGTPQNYTVPVSGVYWLAMVQSSNAIKFAATSLFRSNFLPRRRELGASSTLPAAAGTLSNPAAALILVALIEPGVVIPT